MTRPIAALEAWLTRDRALAVAVMLVPVMLILETAEIWLNPAFLGRFPFGHDFVAFWLAARLAATGAFSVLYDDARFAALQEAISVRPGYLEWHYPPTYLMALRPLAGLGFPAAWAVFSAGGIAALACVGRRVLPVPGRLGWVALLGAPVIGVTLVQGQNGAWVAAALLGGLWAREKGWGWLAALCFSVLVAKPHLALALPVALIAARDWRLIGQTALIAAGWVGLSALTLGPVPWQLFFANLGTVSTTLSDPILQAQMPTAYAAARLVGLPVWLAVAGQSLSALVALALVWRFWAGAQTRAEDPAGPDLRVAAVLMAVLLVPPYGFRYDMVTALVATLALARVAVRQGWLPGERLTVAALWAGPALFPAATLFVPVQTGFFLQLLGLWAIWRRRPPRSVR